MVQITLSQIDKISWKNINVVLHEFILDPGEILVKGQPNQKLERLAKLYANLPQREHLPNTGAMFCRMKMQHVLEINLALKHAISQEVIDAEYILDLLEKLMHSLSELRKSLLQGGFQQEIYSNQANYGGVDPAHEQRLLESQRVASRLSTFQKMLFKKRVHFAVENQSQLVSMERKVLQVDSITNSFREHLDAQSFQELSSKAASLFQTKNGQKELKPRDEVLGIMAIPNEDKNYVFTTIQRAVQILETALIPLPPRPVPMESHPNDNDYRCIIFTKPNTKRKHTRISPDVKKEIKTLCIANKNSQIKEIKDMSPGLLGQFSNEQIRQQMRTLDSDNTTLQRKKRKTPSKWTDVETNAVIEGYRRFPYQHARIKNEYCTTLKNRDNIAIKDKIRNLIKKGILSE